MASVKYGLRLDWSDLHLFLEIARAGTLSAAAPRLGLSQPTAGRRLRAMEATIGASLFQRSPTGFRLTEEGEAMRLHAESMEADAHALERKLMGQAQGFEGLLRLSAPDWFARTTLSPIIADFSIAHPLVTVEILADTRMLDLDRREADIVFRFQRFAGPNVLQRRFAHIRYSVYAAAAYLDRMGPGTATDTKHQLITMDTAFDTLSDVTWLRQRWPQARFAIRSNSRDIQAEACVQGAGLAVLPRAIGDALPLLRLDLAEDPPGRDVWLGYHPDLKRLGRLRALVDCLVEGAGPDIG